MRENVSEKHIFHKTCAIYLVALCNGNDLKTKTTDLTIFGRKLSEKSIGIEIDGRPNLKRIYRSTAWVINSHWALLLVLYQITIADIAYAQRINATKDDLELLRTREAYEEELRIIRNLERVEFDETQGLKYYCKLNDLRYFHI